MTCAGESPNDHCKGFTSITWSRLHLQRAVSNMLLIVDHFSKYAEVAPTRRCDSKSAAKLLEREVLLRHGIPEEVFSDQGKHCQGDFKSFLQLPRATRTGTKSWTW